MSDTPSEPSTKPTKRAAKRARKPQPSEELKHQDRVPEVSSPEVSAAPEPSAPEPSAKRPKRRRGKKGKGGGEHARKDAAEEGQVDSSPSGNAEPPSEDAANEATQASPSPPRPPHAPQQPARTSRHDPESLAKKAWKIYLAEVSEEGIALIGDQDAREISRRCFRLAEIFMDEQSRHT